MEWGWGIVKILPGCNNRWVLKKWIGAHGAIYGRRRKRRWWRCRSEVSWALGTANVGPGDFREQQVIWLVWNVNVWWGWQELSLEEGAETRQEGFVSGWRVQTLFWRSQGPNNRFLSKRMTSLEWYLLKVLHQWFGRKIRKRLIQGSRKTWEEASPPVLARKAPIQSSGSEMLLSGPSPLQSSAWCAPWSSSVPSVKWTDFKEQESPAVSQCLALTLLFSPPIGFWPCKSPKISPLVTPLHQVKETPIKFTVDALRGTEHYKPLMPCP